MGLSGIKWAQPRAIYMFEGPLEIWNDWHDNINRFTRYVLDAIGPTFLKVEYVNEDPRLYR